MDTKTPPETFPQQVLETLARKRGLNPFSREFAEYLDSEDSLREYRSRFDYPKNANLPGVNLSLVEGETECIYFCGNSLGLKPKTVEDRVGKVLTSWGAIGVNSHFHGYLPAASCDAFGREELGRLVGADPSTVVLMNGLTVNLNLLLLSFYVPSETRFKVVIEGHAFPSDRYAIVSQVRLRGLNPDEAVVQLHPRPGEHTLHTDDILQVLKEQGPSIAVVCLSGVQYYTGQKFDMERITQAAQEQGCLVGWDLAHAIGNVEIKLDDWGVDFACWCTYKYLNGGPGCIAGAYVNKKHNNCSNGAIGPMLQGWWGNKNSTRMEMREERDSPTNLVDSFRLCNPPPTLVAQALASLEIFEEVGMKKILEKQFLLTGYLEMLVKSHFGPSETGHPVANIITPAAPSARGCQLSIIFAFPLKEVHDELKKRGVVCDIRLPSVMRLAPAPLYNTFNEVHRFIATLKNVLELCKNENDLDRDGENK